MEKADYDAEAAPPPAKTQEAESSRPLFEAAALLLMWSVLVLNEGSIRFVRAAPAAPNRTARVDETGADQIPPIALVVIAAFECAFGILGILVGAWALIAKGGNTKTTALFLVIQSLLGWPVFITYVWAVPAFTAARNIPGAPGVPEQLTESQAKFFVIMGLLGSISFCLALQGGQFVMGLRLLSYQSGGTVATKAIKMNRGRTVFWNSNMILGAFATVATGALLVNKVGDGKIPPFQSPPNVGTYPVLTIITGLFMFCHGVLGVASAFSKTLVKLLMYATVPVYILMYLNFSIWQLGSIPSADPAFAAGMHSGLVIVTVALGPYFAYQYSKE